LIKKRIEQTGVDSIFNATGLSEVFFMEAEDLGKAAREYTGASFYQEKLEKLALEFMGGDIEKHRVTYTNTIAETSASNNLTTHTQKVVYNYSG